MKAGEQVREVGSGIIGTILGSRVGLSGVQEYCFRPCSHPDGKSFSTHDRYGDAGNFEVLSPTDQEEQVNA